MARTKVFIVGSFTDGLTRPEKDFQFAATALGRALADASCDLVLCSDRESTADHWVFEGYRSGSDPRGVTIFRPEPRYSRDGIAKQPFSGCQDKRILLAYPLPRGAYRTSHLRGIAASDVVVAIAGTSKGTMDAISAAEVLLKPVAGVRGFGGATEEASSDYSRYYDDESRRVLCAIPDGYSADWATRFVEGVVRLGKVNPVARSSVRINPLLATMILLCAAAAWTLGYSNAWNMLLGHRLPVISGMLLTASAFLVALQQVATVAGLPVPARNLAPPIIQWLLGLGVSAVLIFIALAAGNLLANKTIEPSTLEDLQKTALTVTGFALVSTLATEAAWKKIQDWATTRTA